jgi:undecaprenyl-diphosphatase
MTSFLAAIILGFVEGLTEFIPVSSTGHLVLFAQWLQFSSPGHVFEVFIQLGAILAVMVLYRKKICDTVHGIGHDKTAQKFTLNVILATVPVLLVGLLTHSLIKEHLYTAPVIAGALIVGGFLILFLEKRLQNSTTHNIDDISIKASFWIGLIQVLALVPGISRSGATIIGGLALGLNRPVAAEFSFFLAIPAIMAAALYDLYKNWDALMNYDGFYLLFVGFAVAFVSSFVTLKIAMRFINRWGFAPFAWYRIAAGILVLALI